MMAGHTGLLLRYAQTHENQTKWASQESSTHRDVKSKGGQHSGAGDTQTRGKGRVLSKEFDPLRGTAATSFNGAASLLRERALRQRPHCCRLPQRRGIYAGKTRFMAALWLLTVVRLPRFTGNLLYGSSRCAAVDDSAPAPSLRELALWQRLQRCLLPQCCSCRKVWKY